MFNAVALRRRLSVETGQCLVCTNNPATAVVRAVLFVFLVVVDDVLGFETLHCRAGLTIGSS